MQVSIIFYLEHHNSRISVVLHHISLSDGKLSAKRSYRASRHPGEIVAATPEQPPKYPASPSFSSTPSRLSPLRRLILTTPHHSQDAERNSRSPNIDPCDQRGRHLRRSYAEDCKGPHRDAEVE